MLPKGITGFRDFNDRPVPEQDEKMFKKLCYSIAQQYSCMVVSFDFDLASKNFYSAEMKSDQGRLYILGNAYYPWIAFAKKADLGEIEFMESPFQKISRDVHLLTLSELQEGWHHSVGKLSKAELDQIEYWKPETLGEIIFNFWG